MRDNITVVIMVKKKKNKNEFHEAIKVFYKTISKTRLDIYN